MWTHLSAGKTKPKSHIIPPLTALCEKIQLIFLNKNAWTSPKQIKESVASFLGELPKSYKRTN